MPYLIGKLDIRVKLNGLKFDIIVMKSDVRFVLKGFNVREYEEFISMLYLFNYFCLLYNYIFINNSQIIKKIYDFCSLFVVNKKVKLLSS